MSSENAQRSCYISFRRDPEVQAIDAFSLSWKALDFYAFPPLSVILRVVRVLQKVWRNRESRVITAPVWPTLVWWQLLNTLLIREPVTLPSRTSLLFRPSQPVKTRHLLLKLHLLVCKISEADYMNVFFFFSSTDAASLMLNSWRPITQKVYDTYIRKWEKYAGGLCKCVIS